MIWGDDYQSIRSPFGSMGITIGSFRIPIDYVIIIGVTIAILVGLWLLLRRTRLGLALRATSQNRKAAMLSGINVERMDMVAFGIGAGLAGAAGTLWAVSGLVFDPYMGSVPAVKAFAIVILGGLGSIPGAIIGGLFYGVAESAATYTLGGAWKDAISFVVLIVVLDHQADRALRRAGGLAWTSNGFGLSFAWVALAVALLVPGLRSRGATTSLTTASIALVFMIYSQAWNFLAASGQGSLGHAAFFGLGAYASALIATGFGLPPILTVPARRPLRGRYRPPDRADLRPPQGVVPRDGHLRLRDHHPDPDGQPVRGHLRRVGRNGRARARAVVGTVRAVGPVPT